MNMHFASEEELRNEFRRTTSESKKDQIAKEIARRYEEHPGFSHYGYYFRQWGYTISRYNWRYLL